MPNSPIVRLTIGCLIVLAFCLGFMFDEFVYILAVESPLLPSACIGLLVMMLWSADSLLD